ncbi:MAG: anthranilate synthase component I family protein [Opitutales bacterium]
MKKIKQISKTLAGDLQTPVGIYLKIRDLDVQSAMLESCDFHTNSNSFSFIGVEPISSISINDAIVDIEYPDGSLAKSKIDESRSLTDALKDYVNSFEVEDASPINGFFGYTAYDCVKYFENIQVVKESSNSPDLMYILYRFVIVLNHFKDELVIIENIPEGEESKMAYMESVLHNNNYAQYGFDISSELRADTTEEKFIANVEKSIEHIKRGDIFQIVLSRGFSVDFSGDEFNVYRALRRINPSPYLFYFDFGAFKIFGSSPETHLKIEEGIAQIDPIAGTFMRTGDDKQDSILAQKLLADEKENSEHTMLVDLARNDLSRSCRNVKVDFLKQIQYYSHLIHMVSRVSGEVRSDDKALDLLADTFPAGTLSGAPKVRAMQIINDLEGKNRGFYGGCIGSISFNGDLNQAITIRSFLSKDNTLRFQAGAGIVADSRPTSELQEINNKLGALFTAIEKARA